MGDEFTGELLSGDSIHKELGKRKKRVFHESIKSKDKDVLEKLKQAKELEGWRVTKEFKSSIRMEIGKPGDQLLEDEIWTIAAKMGFHTLNKDRHFKLRIDSLYHQIDILAKDKESVILVECTQTDVPRKKSMLGLLQKIAAIKGGAARSIVSHFGRSPKLKIGWVVATRNIEWSTEDLQRAKDNKITVLCDRQIDYFAKLSDHLKDAARYQFLAYIFQDEEVSGLGLKVPATRGQMGGNTFYNFVINPSDLLKICYVSHKAIAGIETIETYQRLMSSYRLNKIAKYIDSGGQFPTNIVINIHSRKKLRFEEKDVIGSSAFGTLYLPTKYACAWVIDGQHRLFGYARSRRASTEGDKTTFPVLAYENLSSDKEARMFVDVNHEQVSVPNNLLKEIYLTLNWNTENFKDMVDSLSSRVVLMLDQRPTSPLYDRIIFTIKPKTNKRCLTLTQISESLKENRFFGEEKNGIRFPGPMTHRNSSELDLTMEKAYSCLSLMFESISGRIPHHWELGDDVGGFLSTNMGIRSLMRVLRAILNYIERKDEVQLYVLKPDDFMPQVIELLSPIVEYFERADGNAIQKFRSQRAMAGVTKNSFEMLRLINGTYPEFNPSGLQEYIATQDEEGTKESRRIIDEISSTLSSFVKIKLQSAFGEDWWRSGVPEKIRVDKAALRERDETPRELEAYLYLIDYREIALSNWSLFEEYFTFEPKGNKTARTNWLVELNRIRNITHHPEKGLLDTEQVEHVRFVKRKIDENFNGLP